MLRTERLILRGHRPEDLAASAAMWAEPSFTRCIGGQPPSRAETRAWLRRQSAFGVTATNQRC